MSTSFADYAARGKNSWWRYVVTIIIAFAVQTVLTVIGMGIAMASGIQMEDIAAMMKDASNPVAFFTIAGGSFAALLIGFALGALWLNKKTPADVIGRWSWAGYGAGLVVWLGMLFANLGIDYLLRPTGFTFTPNALTLVPVLVTCAALAVQTFAEEFIFRGYLTQGIYKAVPKPWIASVISGLIFGACHIPNGIPQAVSAAILGVALGWIAIRTGGIAFAYGLHMINNIFGAVIVVSGGDVFKGAPGLITQTTPDLMWVDVGFVAVALAVIVAVMMLRPQAKSAPQDES